ncbi:MAG: hypothetical protein K0B09_06395 [Bacteroidales bacterium]|nr:hypothetical protein [Bacteroidales bacterium]
MKSKSIKFLIEKTQFAALVVILLSALLMWSCGGGGGQQKVMEEQLNEVKESVTADLADIKDDLEERIAYLDSQIEEAGEDVKEELLEAREDLQVQLSTIENELEKVREASLDTWDAVVAETNNVVSEVRSKTNEASLKVRELLEDE